MNGSSSWLVHEYVSGGGWDAGPLPAGLAVEALAILRAILADCAAWGQVRTLTLRDARLAGADLPANEIIDVGPGQYAAALAATLARCDAALLVAPETGGALASLSCCAQRAGVRVLGASPEAIRDAGDKWACYGRWRAAGVPTPLTRQATPSTARAVARELGYPLVVKPGDGVGCDGVSLVRGPDELRNALAIAGHTAAGSPILLQQYVSGKPASVSLLAACGRALPLSLNAQDIEAGMPFRYRGGSLPLAHPAQSVALAVAQAAVEALPGLQGYAGVDLVLDGARAWAIELNPRLTTAYIGLRRVLDINLAEAIWTACTQGRLPPAVGLRGHARWSLDGPGGLEEVTWGVS